MTDLEMFEEFKNFIKDNKENIEERGYTIEPTNFRFFSYFTEMNINEFKTIHYGSIYQHSDEFFISLKVSLTSYDKIIQITNFIIHKWQFYDIVFIGHIDVDPCYSYEKHSYVNKSLTPEKMEIIKKLINNGEISEKETKRVFGHDIHVKMSLVA